ncbi:hypothetical protein NPIL_108671 [Nephila pilipes]|uniref:Uncharacterized protein n=1 Tax=Nephila pilipes TaxID=299642 RepID=A0A8X6N535_NEPPI|nr:hypothetical protein NPIL_108671 [Nephila pilipes]
MEENLLACESENHSKNIVSGGIPTMASNIPAAGNLRQTDGIEVRNSILKDGSEKRIRSISPLPTEPLIDQLESYLNSRARDVKDISKTHQKLLDTFLSTHELVNRLKHEHLKPSTSEKDLMLKAVECERILGVNFLLQTTVDRCKTCEKSEFLDFLINLGRYSAVLDLNNMENVVQLLHPHFKIRDFMSELESLIEKDNGCLLKYVAKIAVVRYVQKHLNKEREIGMEELDVTRAVQDLSIPLNTEIDVIVKTLLNILEDYFCYITCNMRIVWGNESEASDFDLRATPLITPFDLSKDMKKVSEFLSYLHDPRSACEITLFKPEHETFNTGHEKFNLESLAKSMKRLTCKETEPSASGESSNLEHSSVTHQEPISNNHTKFVIKIADWMRNMSLMHNKLEWIYLASASATRGFYNEIERKSLNEFWGGCSEHLKIQQRHEFVRDLVLRIRRIDLHILQEVCVGLVEYFNEESLEDKFASTLTEFLWFPYHSQRLQKFSEADSIYLDGISSRLRDMAL